MPELMVGVGTRATAIGGAGVASTDDLYSVYWNPSGLGNISHMDLELCHGSLIADVKKKLLGFGLPIGEKQYLALGANYWMLGSIDQTGITTQRAHGHRPGNLESFHDGAQYRVRRGFAFGPVVGGRGQILTESLGTKNLRPSLDLGLQYPFAPIGLTLGLALQNLGAPVDGYSLPMEARAGAAEKIKLAEYHRLVFSVDAELPVEATSQSLVHAGLEYGYSNFFFIRAGYAVSDANSQGSLSGLTAGFGFLFNSWNVGFTYAPYGNLGTTERVSLGFDITSLLAPTEPVKRKRVRRPKTTTPSQMSFNMSTGSGPTGPPVLDKPSGPGAGSGSSVSEDEEIMRSLLQKGLTVDVEIKSEAGSESRAKFKVQRASGPMIQSWTLAIKNQSGKTAAFLSGKGQPTEIVWDGKGRNGKTVPISWDELNYELVLVDVNHSLENAQGALVAAPSAAGRQKRARPWWRRKKQALFILTWAAPRSARPRPRNWA